MSETLIVFVVGVVAGMILELCLYLLLSKIGGKK